MHALRGMRTQNATVRALDGVATAIGCILTINLSLLALKIVKAVSAPPYTAFRAPVPVRDVTYVEGR